MTFPPLPDMTDYGNAPGSGPLRPGGQSVAGIPTLDKDKPDQWSKAAKRQAEDLLIMRHLWAGTRAMRDNAGLYLPKAPGENAEDYRVRVQRSVLTNITRNTIEGLTAYIFREDPELGEDVPPAIVQQWENIDNAGTHGDVFVRGLTADAMTAGHCAILVEFPKTGGTQSLGDEQTAIRPYWVHLLKENLVSWRPEVIDGRLILTQLVVRECQTVPDGRFGEKEQTRYRVFTREDGGLVGFQLLEIQDNKSVLVIDEGLYPTQDEIPVAEVRSAGSRSLFESDPPFMDLAHLNIAHLRQWSDYDTYLHKTCFPTYCEAGTDPGATQDGQPPKIVLGPGHARLSTNPEFKSWYTETSGASLAACKTALDDLKTDMAMLGLAALQSSKRVAETAMAKELDKSASDSALAVTARGVQDGVERALYFHARYLKLDDGGSLSLNRDYETPGLDAPKMQVWVNLAKDLGVPLRFVLEIFRENGEIPEGTDLDELERQIMANQAAMEAQRQADQEAQMEALQARGGNVAPL